MCVSILIFFFWTTFVCLKKYINIYSNCTSMLPNKSIKQSTSNSHFTCQNSKFVCMHMVLKYYFYMFTIYFQVLV